MIDADFSPNELRTLCSLYLEAQLTRREEIALMHYLMHKESLDTYEQHVLQVMKAEYTLALQKEPRHKYRPLLYAAAAIVLPVMIFIGISMFRHQPQIDTATYTVWIDGQQIRGDSAKKLVEECESIDMESLRKVMKLQREMFKLTYGAVNPDEVE